ncbi:MAG: hypothetical protein E2P02_16800 [Acidobacteria bacterium]|nr:MAG: hypothetical protein E2P02_16800 [Acidobacteriota bacterium]
MTSLNIAFVALALVLFLWMPDRGAPIRRSSLLATVVLLLLALFVVPPAVDSFRELASPLRGVLGDGRDVARHRGSAHAQSTRGSSARGETLHRGLPRSLLHRPTSA